jgi:galactose mutarotase-like enzyme
MHYTLQNELLRAGIKAEGAELCSLRRLDLGLEYIWEGNPDIWGRHAPVLFPIVGRLKDNTYHWQGQTYNLPQHGFARDRRWNLIEKGEQHLRFGLRDDEESRKIYPFAFDFQMEYRLEGEMLSVNYRIENPGEGPLYFSVGGHPAFVCPLKEGESFADYRLEFEQAEKLERETLQMGLRTGQTEPVLQNESLLPLSHRLFDQDALIFKNPKSNKVRLVSGKHAHGVELAFADFPYLGVWSKAGQAPFVCLEPWLGLADSQHSQGEISRKEGIQLLQPGEELGLSFQIRVF